MAGAFRLTTRRASPHADDHFVRPYDPAGSTTSVRSSRATMRTRAPGLAPASQRASQISPSRRTCPNGRQGSVTTASRPINVSAPTTPRRFFTVRFQPKSSATQIGMTTTKPTMFQGDGSSSRSATATKISMAAVWAGRPEGSSSGPDEAAAAGSVREGELQGDKRQAEAEVDGQHEERRGPPQLLDARKDKSLDRENDEPQDESGPKSRRLRENPRGAEQKRRHERGRRLDDRPFPARDVRELAERQVLLV